MKLLVFADLHLDAPFSTFGREVARTRRRSLRNTLERIVDLALEEKVDAVLCAGDLYEQEHFRTDTGEFLRAAFERLGGTPVVIAPGNHDWYGPGSLYAQVHWTPNVHIFKDPELAPYRLGDEVLLWGAAHCRPAGTAGFLTDFFARGEEFHLGLFHGAECGTLRFEEEGKELHAPFEAASIAEAGLLHAFVGHYHNPRDNEFYTYPGNPEPLTFGETGERGVILAELKNRRLECTRRIVATTALTDVRVDVTGSMTGDEIRTRVRDRLAEVEGLVRLSVRGEVDPAVDIDRSDFTTELAPHLDALVLSDLEIEMAYDLEVIVREPTVRGQFLRDVDDSDLTPEEKRLVVTTGLRAFDQRDDLEVF